MKTAKAIDIQDLTRTLLNELLEPVSIGKLSYPAGDALEKLDPVAFHQECLNYVDCLMSDGEVIETENGEYLWASDVEAIK